MTKIERLASHISAWRSLPKLRELTIEKRSIEDIVTRTFNYCDGFMGLDQVWGEIVEALKAVQALRPRYVIEIGSAGGGTLLLWSRVAHPEATIISIDLPGGQPGTRASLLRTPFLRRMGLPGQKIYTIRGNSHDQATLERTRRLLKGNAADYLFIDGDHSEAGVRADYEMYGPLVREGGIIGFHDVAVDSPECQVIPLWRELETRSGSRTIAGLPPTYGIGLLYI